MPLHAWILLRSFGWVSPYFSMDLTKQEFNWLDRGGPSFNTTEIYTFCYCCDIMSTTFYAAPFPNAMLSFFCPNNKTNQFCNHATSWGPNFNERFNGVMIGTLSLCQGQEPGRYVKSRRGRNLSVIHFIHFGRIFPIGYTAEIFTEYRIT